MEGGHENGDEETRKGRDGVVRGGPGDEGRDGEVDGDRTCRDGRRCLLTW